MPTKTHPTPDQHPQPSQTNHPEEVKKGNETLPLISMILGVISLTGPGLVFGIPAIITGAIALKHNAPNRGLSITGLVTGIVSTALSVLVTIVIILAFIWGLDHPDPSMHQNNPGSHRGVSEQLFESSPM